MTDVAVLTEMHQVAPWPSDLVELVETMKYRKNWACYTAVEDRGQGCSGLTFNVLAHVQDSSPPHEMMRVRHLFPVPAAAFNRISWKRWILDRILDVESHEACEFLELDGDRCFRPHHSEGEDPYTIWHIGDAETAGKASREK